MSVPGNPDETYSWTSLNNPGFSSTGPGATINIVGLNDGGRYVITVISGSTGCTGRDTADVRIIPLPGVADGVYNGPLCAGDTLALNVNDTSTDVSYVWTGPNGFTSPYKQSFKQGVGESDSGPYIVIVERENKCTRRDTLDVLVKPRPAAPDISSNSPITSGETLYLEMKNPATGASFQWRGPNNYGS